MPRGRCRGRPLLHDAPRCHPRSRRAGLRVHDHQRRHVRAHAPLPGT
uniref:Uncharacterized protein n=1 Tax=Arundo donax TaxID=35708 RepID=A0A0A9BV68_ARUDO